MRLQLPPGRSAAQFEAGLAAFRAAVGDDWVLATDLDRDTYSDFYAPGDEELHAPGAAVAPGSVEETRAVVRLANEHRIPLWPVSRGKNLGYGAAAPRVAGTVVLDMGRMRRILEVSPELAYCVVEPGVSFFDLYEHLQANEIPLWMSVPGNAWGSVMGNALDRGDWTGGRGAHLGFSPIVPATGAHVLRQLHRSRELIAAHDVDFYASFTIGERAANNINMLMYDRDNEEQVANIRALFSALVAQAREAGYGEYRTHLTWMDPVSDTFDFNDHALRRMNEKIKDALDPNGIIAPGKQGVWPGAMRAQRT